jgi:hypothetical protein
MTNGRNNIIERVPLHALRSRSKRREAARKALPELWQPHRSCRAALVAGWESEVCENCVDRKLISWKGII